jgi:DNA processing protein
MPKLNAEEFLARIKINAFTYLKSDWYLRLIKEYGSAEEILKKTPGEISRDGSISKQTAENFLKEAHAFDASAEIERVEKIGGKILVSEDEQYPELLKTIEQPPIVLYVLGEADFSVPTIAMVGTRKPSFYGKRVAQVLGRDISNIGFVVVSGLARGIDSLVQESVVKAGNKTWAVLGNGLGRCYPAENKKLAKDILDKGGALISEFPFETSPMPFHFPRRNRIISGLSLATLVVEGNATSGALITAKFALEQNREVFAVPGPVDSLQSEGPNNLINSGAHIVGKASDVLDFIPSEYLSKLKPQKKENDKKTESGFKNFDRIKLSSDEKTVLNMIKQSEQSLDELTQKLGWDVPKTAGVLFALETKSVLECAGGIYSIKSV